MIVVAIIGIISAVAYPSYVEHIVRSNRAEAADALSEVMFEQERYQIRRRTYTADLSDMGYVNSYLDTDRDLYRITAGVCDGEANVSNCVLLTATPRPNSIQAKKNDGNVTLNSRGEKNDKWED